MEQIITCINCPMGCRMTVNMSPDGKVLSVSGNTCPRGEKYAVQECTLPVRMITAVIPAEGSAVPLSVKTSRPVPKALIRQVMDILGSIRITLPVRAGQVIVPDILQTGSDIIATRDLP